MIKRMMISILGLHGKRHLIAERHALQTVSDIGD